MNFASSAGNISFFPTPPLQNHQNSIATMSATTVASPDKKNSVIATSSNVSDSFFNSSLPIKSSHENETDSKKSSINWLLDIYRRRVELYQRQLEEQRLLLIQVVFFY